MKKGKNEKLINPFFIIYHEVHNMSLDLPLDALELRLASEVKEKKFKGKIESVQVKTDAYGRQLVQLNVYSDKYGRVIIALSPSYTNIMVRKLKEMGFKKLGDIVGKWFIFERIKLEKVKEHYTDPYPRFIPVKVALGD